MIGRRTRPVAAGSLLVLAATLAPVAPAEAQVGAFLDSLFGGRKEQPAPEPAPEPAPAPAPQAAPAPAAKKPAKAAEKSGEAKGTEKAAKAGEKSSEKTGSLKPGAAPKAPAEAKVAAVGAPAAVLAPAEPADPATVLAQANGYFNGLSTLTGTFVQIGPDGRRIGGKLTLAKPGRLRFEYDQPSPLEVVADGTSVAVRDRKLATQDTYFIAQTPLKFLLREKIDLTVTEVANDPGGVRIALEDRATLGGTSRIQLYFDADVKTLQQWRITDPQGYLTTVQLSNLQKGRPVDGTLFFINYGRPEDKAMAERIRQSQQNP